MEKPLSVRIRRVVRIEGLLAAELAALVPQLSPRAAVPDAARLARVVASPNALLLVAELDGRTAGMCTLGWYETPTGLRAWLEDVVVDKTARGCGAGRELVRAAAAEARRLGAASLMLTSAEHRVAARALYASEGFLPVDTTLFGMK